MLPYMRLDYNYTLLSAQRYENFVKYANLDENLIKIPQKAAELSMKMASKVQKRV
jgi:hypothetical protein